MPILLFAVSCSELLDLSPLDRLSPSSFFKSESEFENALTACYGHMQDEIYYMTPYWDNFSGNSYARHGNGGAHDIVSGNITVTSGGFISDVFTRSYERIARVNLFLEQLANTSVVSDARKASAEAEARMLRAYFYSYLYRCYGSVPVADKPLDVETQYMAKKPASEVRDFMMADIDFAISNLRDVTYKECGRWTVNAAKAYKARMLLYDAYDASGNAIPDVMNQASTLLNQITGYTLAADYSDNFNDKKQQESPEIMMSIKFFVPGNGNNADQYLIDWNQVNPLANFISLYDMADGTPGTPVPFESAGIIEEFTNADLALREPRAAKTLYITEYRHPLTGDTYYQPPGHNASNTKAGMIKFMSLDMQPPIDDSKSGLSAQDWVIMRWADVLLMKAEVENELNATPPASVYAALNEIRVRAGGENLRIAAGTLDDKSAMRAAIRKERRIELAFEGVHYFDIKRWKTIKDVYANVKDGISTYRFEDRHYLWPLPDEQIVRSQGILEQNPDYK